MVCMLMSGKLRFNLSFTFELDPKCGQKWLNDAWKCRLGARVEPQCQREQHSFSPSGQKTLHKTVSCSFIDLIGPIHFTTFVSHSMRCSFLCFAESEVLPFELALKQKLFDTMKLTLSAMMQKARQTSRRHPFLMWEKEDILVFCLVTSQSRFTYFHLGFPNSPRFFFHHQRLLLDNIFPQKSQGAALRKRFPSHCWADFALVVCQHRLLDPEMRVSDVVVPKTATPKRGFTAGPGTTSSCGCGFPTLEGSRCWWWLGF